MASSSPAFIPIALPLARPPRMSMVPPAGFHRGRRALGVDYGARRVGLAVRVGLGVAVPAGAVEHRRDAGAAAAGVAAAAMREGAASVVVGLPLLEAGTEGVQARRTRAFVAALRTHLRGTGTDLWLEKMDWMVEGVVGTTGA